MKQSGQPIRINLLHKLDDLLEVCKSCEKRKQTNNSISPEVACKGCQIYSEIRYIGENLGRKKQMAKITLSEYQALSNQGITDAEIAKQFGVKQPTIVYYKKKWSTDSIQPDTAELKPSETENTQEDKTAEYEAIIAELKAKLEERDTQLISSRKANEELSRMYEAKKNVDAACEDVESELASLRDENATLKKNYHHYKFHADQLEDGYKHVNKTIERYEEENKALRSLLRLWM